MRYYFLPSKSIISRMQCLSFSFSLRILHVFTIGYRFRSNELEGKIYVMEHILHSVDSRYDAASEKKIRFEVWYVKYVYYIPEYIRFRESTKLGLRF